MWRNERLGLLMIVASLAVISVIATLLFHSQQKTQEEQIRTQVSSLAHLLNRMTWEQLVSQQGGQDILSILHHSRGESHYAYGSVINTEGDVKKEMAVSGVAVPKFIPLAEPSSWLGEREVMAGDGHQSFIEFYTPVISDGILYGYVRLGYFKPGLGLSYEQLPFLATLALPIFLLTPLFYFLIKREVRPLQGISQTMEEMLEKTGSQKIEVHASSEMGEFFERFNRFIALTSEKMHELEGQRSDLMLSSKMLTYKQNKVEALLQTIPESIVVLDLAGIPTYCNAKITALLGVTPEQVIGKKTSEWCSNPEVIAYLARYEQQVTQNYLGEPVFFNPQVHPEKKLELHSYPLFLPTDQTVPLGTLVVIRDITEEDLLRTSRGEFVAQVAHELKTPLNILAMYSESLLGEEGESKAFRVEGLNVIHDEVERLSTLINNLLSITKFELGGMQISKGRVRLHDLLEDAFTSVAKNGRGRELDFRLDLPKEMSSLYADKDLLSVAVNNLLTNAIKYNRSGGKVTLVAEETDDAFEISVSDTGIGISEDDQQRIFEKFYRSDDDQVREQTGHGLGLSLANQIIKLHQGSLKLKSEPGQGSEFSIRLDKDTNILQQAV